MSHKKAGIHISPGKEITDQDIRAVLRYKEKCLKKLQDERISAIAGMNATSSDYIANNAICSRGFAGGCGKTIGRCDKIPDLVIRAIDSEKKARVNGERLLRSIERKTRKYFIIMLAYKNLERQKDRDVLDVAEECAEVVYAAAKGLRVTDIKTLPSGKVISGAKNARFQARKRLWANISDLIKETEPCEKA